MERIKLTRISGKGCFKTMKSIGKNTALTIEASDTILLNKKTINQSNNSVKSIILRAENFIAKPIKTPKVVDIPFPPLNLRNGVRLCPNTAATANIILKSTSSMRTPDLIQ